MNSRPVRRTRLQWQAKAVFWIALSCGIGFAVCSLLPAATTDTVKGQRLKKFLQLKVTPTPAPTPTPAATPTPVSEPTSAPRPAMPPTIKATPTPSPEEVHAQQEKEAKRLFDLAVGCIGRDRRDEAKTYLRRIVREFPKTDLAPHALVQMAEIENDLAEVDRALAQVIKDYPKTKWAEVAWYMRGDVNVLRWDYGQALEMYGEFLKRNPGHAREGVIRRQVAICRLKLGRAKEALAELETLRAERPELADQPETLETLAECHVALEDGARAIEALETLLKKHPNYKNRSRVFLLHALCLEDSGRFEEAMEAYRQLVERFPRTREAALADSRLADLRRPLTLQGPADTATTATTRTSDQPATTPTGPAAPPGTVKLDAKRGLEF